MNIHIIMQKTAIISNKHKLESTKPKKKIKPDNQYISKSYMFGLKFFRITTQKNYKI